MAFKDSDDRIKFGGSQSMFLRSSCDGTCIPLDRSEKSPYSLSKRGRSQERCHHHHHFAEIQEEPKQLNFNDGFKSRLFDVAEECNRSVNYLPKISCRRVDSSIAHRERLDIATKETSFYSISSVQMSSSQYLVNRNQETLVENDVRNQLTGRRSQLVTSAYGLDSELDTLDNTMYEESEHHLEITSLLTQSRFRFLISIFLAFGKVLYKFGAYALLADLWLLSSFEPARNYFKKYWKAFLFLLPLVLLPIFLLPSIPDSTYTSSNEKVTNSYGHLLNISSTIWDQLTSYFYVQNQRENFSFKDVLTSQTSERLVQESDHTKYGSINSGKIHKCEEDGLLKDIVISLQNKVQKLEEENLEIKSRIANLSFVINEKPLLWRQWFITTLFEVIGSSENSDELAAKIFSLMKTSLVGKEDFHFHLGALLEELEKLKLFINATTTKDVENGVSNITIEDVLLIIKRQLAIFDADQLSLPDYALESAGGSVINTRCSETFKKQSSQLVLFGIPLWHLDNSPRTVIQPGRNPGNCWSFVGSEGYIVIQLSHPVYPSAFSIEHIPKTISPTGNIDSAPKDFSVWGLKMESDSGVLLGKYVYEDNGQPLQTFAVQGKNAGVFNIVELKIHSNHGHPEFTCLYRFRVHGTLASKPLPTTK